MFVDPLGYRFILLHKKKFIIKPTLSYPYRTNIEINDLSILDSENLLICPK
jgi:hypothetical protein